MSDKFNGKRVPNWANPDKVDGQRLDAATYIGIVKNNVDPIRSGRLQVWIPEFGGSQNDTTQNNSVFWRTVNYASPYFGSTQPQASANNNFETNNQTYGMWMVPPDVGNQVLCTFVNGDPNRGYWFACISPTLSHYMVPGIAAGNKLANVSPAMAPSIVKNSQPPQSLPSVEFNENQPDAINSSFYENPKPIHEFQANVLFKQGLDRDSTRGAISSSSQRETPSHVFGISTPGRPDGNDPADNPNYQNQLATGTLSQSDYAVKRRKGGHQFVMDDGDTLGVDQLLRLRSAGGHQILMHDSKKTMYIANSEGSVWIELSESGHMHIYTAGGFNLRTEGELNMHAKTIKMQSEGDFNIAAGNGFNVSASSLSLTGINGALLYGGKVNVGSGGSMTLGASQISVGASGAIAVNGSTIDLNNGGGGNSIGPATLQAYKHDDTSYDQKSRLWNAVAEAASSIVGIMPAHEPWARSASTLGAAPEKQVENSICPPMSGTSGAGMSGSNFVGGAGPFGDFIANNEAGAAQYNAFNRGDSNTAPRGSGSIGGEKLSLVGMTLAEIQTQMASTKPAERLFATGRYQVIPNTLAPAISALKLDTATKYDEKTQDYIFNNFLCRIARPPIAQYFDNPDQNNASLLQAAAFSTAQCWASIGVPAGMKTAKGATSDGSMSYYGGIGGNKAHSSADRAIESLKAQWKYLRDKKAGGGADQASPATAANTAPATTTQGTLASGSGAVVKDGSGNAVKTGEGGATNSAATDKKDVGITNAAGKAVSGDTCPKEYLSKDTAFNPPGGIGSGKPTLNQNHAKAMHAELGYMESKWDYALIKDPTASEAKAMGPRLGKYQVDAPYLADEKRAYIKSEALEQYKSGTLANDASWTGKDKINSQNSFKEFKSTQDDIQFKEFGLNFDALKANGGIKDSDDLCTAAGMLFVAHQMRSADKAKEWRDKGELKDVNGVPGEVYFNHGRYAIDILSAGAAAGGPAGLGGENTSGVNPDDVFTFTTQGSGTRARFDSLNGEFKTQVCLLGKEYKEKTGSRIAVSSAVRTQDEQTVLYETWEAGGGGKGNPPLLTVNGITTPVKAVGTHGDGIAMDSGQMATVVSAVGAAKVTELGLKWGGDWTSPDKVHVQLLNAPKPNTTPPANPTAGGKGGVVVVGDSIAVGTGASLKQMDSTITVSGLVGASSATILSTYVPPVTGAKIAVVSAGSNDIVASYPTSQTPAAQARLTSTLSQIRSALGAEKCIWILPNFSIASQVVAAFAASNGDATVSFTASGDNVHPANYGTLAAQIKGML
jgi:hypothetical protein